MIGIVLGNRYELVEEIGKGGMAKFMGGGGKANFTVRPTANQRISLAAGYSADAPLAYNSFVAPRLHNNFVNNLKTEKTLSADLSYAFRFGPVSGKVSGYFAQIGDQVEQTAYFNDQYSTFTYLTMSDVEKRYYGVEAALVYQIISGLSVNLMGSYGDALYVNNPYAQVSYEGMKASEIQRLNTCKNPVTGKNMPLQVIADGMRVGGTPLTAVSLGVNYNVSGWFFEANLNYYDRVYLAFSQYRRLNSTYSTAGKFYTPSSVNADGLPAYAVTKAELEANGGILFDNKGEVVDEFAIEQEKFKGGFMLDASIGRSIYLRHGSLSINLMITNVLNNTDLCTGGYEQMRLNKLSDPILFPDADGQMQIVKKPTTYTRFDSKYFYMFGTTYYLNVYFRF